MVYSTALVSGVELRDARRSIDRVKATALAQAGLERAIHELKQSISKTAAFDPVDGVKALFGGATLKPYTPYTRQAVMDGTVKAGEFSVTMSAAARSGGLDVTITATGYSGEPGQSSRQSRSVEAVVRVETKPSSIFDNAYFINNWGWFYGNSIFCNGNAASNGQFDAGGYAPTITGQPKYDDMKWKGGSADLVGYQDSNKDGLQDGNDGGIFAGWDTVAVQNVKGVGGKKENQHDFQPLEEMPNLSELGSYEKNAKASNGQISVGGTVLSNAVYGDEAGEKQNLYLIGTKSKPIKITGTVVVRGDVIIAGVVDGQGSIYSGGNVYVPNNLEYKDSTPQKRPLHNFEKSTEAWITSHKNRTFLGLFARENIVVGDHTHSQWRSYVGSWLGHSLNKSKEDAGEDGIPNTWKGKDGIANTADDDVLEGDGIFTVSHYSQADADAGLLPAGKNVGDVIPGSGEDIDGDGQFDDTITVQDLDLTTTLSNSHWGGTIPSDGSTVSYPSIASNKITTLDGVFYTNHAFAWLTVPGKAINVNGSIVSRNEAIIYGAPSLSINHDARLLGGAEWISAGLLPRVPAPLKVISWRFLKDDAYGAATGTLTTKSVANCQDCDGS